jgi:ribosomal protein L29
MAKKQEPATASVVDLREKLWHYKADLAAGKVKNVREIRRIKKEIARALTRQTHHGT